MNGYLLNQISANADRPAQFADIGARRSRNDRRDSDSGSDHNNQDNAYLHSSTRGDSPEDVHRSLTSQALNADGSPKRPMNAFMIFARRRRPQVSAENQMMRTGEISKLLSKEWTTMSMSEKQFYLDQAKRLKDNFNSKYPDYVYRRRPNNSRKKRRGSDGHLLDRQSESSRTGDPAEHSNESLEPDEASPSDIPDSPSQSLNLSETQPFEDTSVHGHLYTYSRHLSHSSDSEHAVSPVGNDHSLSTSSLSSASPYPSYNDRFFDDFPTIIPHESTHQSTHQSHTNLGPTRLTTAHFSWSDEHGTVGGPTSAPIVGSTQQLTNHTSQASNAHYTSATSHGQQQPMQSLWANSSAGSIEHSVRSGATSSSWPMPPSLTSVAALTGRQRSLTTTANTNNSGSYQSKVDLFSPSLPHRAWSSTPSASSVSSLTSLSASAANPVRSSPFQTLTAPFYPLASNRHTGDNETYTTLSQQPRNYSDLSSGSLSRQENAGNYGYESFNSLPPLHTPTFSTAQFTTHDTGSSSNGSHSFANSQPISRHSGSQHFSSYSQPHVLHGISTSLNPRSQ